MCGVAFGTGVLAMRTPLPLRGGLTQPGNGVITTSTPRLMAPSFLALEHGDVRGSLRGAGADGRRLQLAQRSGHAGRIHRYLLLGAFDDGRGTGKKDRDCAAHCSSYTLHRPSPPMLRPLLVEDIQRYNLMAGQLSYTPQENGALVLFSGGQDSTVCLG